TAAVAQVDQGIPLSPFGQAVDLTGQVVEVAPFDELLAVHTKGHGYGRLEPGSGKCRIRSTAAARFTNASCSVRDSNAANGGGSRAPATSRSTPSNQPAGTGSPAKTHVTLKRLPLSRNLMPCATPHP